MIKVKQISAVVLSAGFSSRMGDFKPLMDLEGKTVLERVLSLLKNNGIDDIVVVTGHNREFIEKKIESCGVRHVFNESFESGMLSSVKKGVKEISAFSSGFLILPVDIPAIRDNSIGKIIDSFDGSKIVMPYFDGRSGHPPLVPKKFRDEILKIEKDSTMHSFFEANKEETIPINLFDRGILIDMDDRDGFLEVRKKILNKEIPDFYECLAIQNFYIKDNEKLKSHLKAVSEVSLIIFDSLDLKLNRVLTMAASLLHDILKGEKNHAEKGAELLEFLGFEKVADIVREHMDIVIDNSCDISEKEIVYFADKICSGDMVELNYEEKFKRKAEIYPHIKMEIFKRYENTRLIQTRIEKSQGKSLKEIFKER